MLRRDGPVWTLEWRGNRSLVRDAKGMRDLAILLAHPDRGVPAVDLVEPAGGPEAGRSGGDLGPSWTSGPDAPIRPDSRTSPAIWTMPRLQPIWDASNGFGRSGR